MKLALSIAVFVGLATLALAADQYVDKYDNINLDDILNNQRLYQKYFNCVLGRGKCTPDGNELKENIPDALQTDCAKCNEKQKKGAEKVLRFLINEKKDDFKLLEEKFDPEGTYKKKYEEQQKLIEKGETITL